MPPLFRFFLGSVLLLLVPAAGPAAQTFASSNLPIVLIDTGEEIPDEPKVRAWMRILDNGPGQRNVLGDAPTGYDGWIGIERRGSTSQSFPKKQYAIETREEDGSNRNVSLLGMPEENDWILHAPYADKSLMRNVLAYHLARRMGRYASRTRYVEVVLNGNYQGVYVLMEKIKRDAGRVNIATLRPDEVSGDDLTGGYIVKIDKESGAESGGWASPFPPAYPTNSTVGWKYHEPKTSEIAPEQAAYIEGVITAFEAAVASPDYEDPEAGYLAHIDLGSFVDYVILSEVSRNIDSYRVSTYLHKDKDSVDGRLKAGPAWDFNLAFGNASYNRGNQRTGFQFEFDNEGDPRVIAFWWPRMVKSAPFREALLDRWAVLRSGPLHSDSISAFIRTTAAHLEEAQARNFERWPILGERVSPNAFVGDTYEEELDYLQDFTLDRLRWLDEALDAPLEPGGPPSVGLSAPWPNPARHDVRVLLSTGAAPDVALDVLDARGRRIQTVYAGRIEAGRRSFTFDTSDLTPGLYLLQARGPLGVVSRPFTVVR